MRREPALIIGAIVLVVEALIQVGVMFGLDLTGDQQAALQGVVAGLAVLGQAVWTRGQVVSPATHDSQLTIAAQTGVTPDEPPEGWAA